MIRKNHIAVLVLIALFGLSSCIDMKVTKLDDAALAQYGDTTHLATGASGRSVFESAVAPLIRNARCVSCHNVTSPMFGQSDQTAAYNAAKSVLNLGVPAQSRLIFKAGDGHCAPTCSILGSGVWSPPVLAWAQAENQVDPGGSSAGSGLPVFVTTATSLDTNRVNAVVDYSLANRGADFTSVSLRVSITDPALGAPNLALITEMKLVNNSNQSVLVEGIQIFQSVDATIDPSSPSDFNPSTGSDFVNVSVVVPPRSTTALSSGSAVLDKEESGGYIAFGFQKLQVSP